MKILHLRSISDDDRTIFDNLCPKVSTAAELLESARLAGGADVAAWTSILSTKAWHAETLITNLPRHLIMRAQELGIQIPSDESQLLAALVDGLQPDVIIFDGTVGPAQQSLAQIRHKPRLSVSWRDDLSLHERHAVDFDLLLSPSEEICAEASRHGAREALWFYTAPPHEVTPRTDADSALDDVVFFGACGPAYSRRSQVLLTLSKGALGWHGGYSVHYFFSAPYDLSALPIGVAMHVDPMGNRSDRRAILARARMALLVSADSPNYEDSLPHLFEASAAGALILSDGNTLISRFFEPEKEIVVYDSAEDLVKKVRWLVDHPEQRCAIAAAAARRYQKDHSLEARMGVLDTEIRRRLNS